MARAGGEDLRRFIQEVLFPLRNLRGMHAEIAGDLVHRLEAVPYYHYNKCFTIVSIIVVMACTGNSRNSMGLAAAG